MIKWNKPSIIFLTSLLVIGAIMFGLKIKKKPEIDFSQSKIEVEHFTLENGMDVLIIPNKRVPAVMHMLWYKVGGIDEKLGKTGLAHYLEHLMFHGTKKYPKDEIDKQVSDFGGSHNAFTSYDFTAYYQTVPKQYLGNVMDMEADRMRNLVLVEEQTKIERKIVLEERLMRRDNSPASVLGEKIREALYTKEHPYGRPLIGYEDDIEGLTHQDALDFYNKYYFPNNTILVLAGDIDRVEAEPLIEQYYAALPRGPEIEVTMADYVPKVSKKIVKHHDKTVSNIVIKRSYLAPDLLSKNKEHAYALAVASHLLSDGKTSILHKRLVSEENLAISVSSSYSDMSRGQTSFGISITLKDKEDEAEILEIIDEEIVKLKSGDINELDLARAKKIFLIETIYSKESYKSLAYILGMNYTTGIALDEILNWDEAINNVSKEDIAKAIEFVFQEKNLVTGYLLPKK